jgi:hypothetical protein
MSAWTIVRGPAIGQGFSLQLFNRKPRRQSEYPQKRKKLIRVHSRLIFCVLVRHRVATFEDAQTLPITGSVRLRVTMVKAMLDC